MDNLSDLSVFVRVVELGSFSAAARALGLPKSTVSRHLGRLEDRLGVRLLHRTSRTLRTTDVGATFYERAARIVAEIADAEAAASNMQVAPRGTLRITAPHSLGELFVADCVSSFLVAYPEVDCDVNLSDRTVDLVEEGYDLAIRVGRLADSSLVAQRLASSPAVLVGSPAYLARRGAPTTIAELSQHDGLMYAYAASASSWRVSPTQTVPVTGRLVTNNGSVQASAAIAGLGLVILPRFIVGPALARGELVEIDLPGLDLDAAVWAVYPHHRHLSAKVRAFVQHALQFVGDVPPWER